MTVPLVTTVVVNYQGREFLHPCLESLARQTLRDRETIVVDNGSTDGSLELLGREFPSVRVVELGRNLGFAAAVNRGAGLARGQYLALLNNDARAEDDWLERCALALEASPETGFCASKVVLADAPDRLDTAGDGFAVAGFGYKVGWLEPAGLYDRQRRVFGASAAAAVFRRSVFEEAGGMDEDYFIYSEDVDLSFRCQLLGYPCVYLPGAVAHHRVRATVGLGSSLSVYLSQRNSLVTTLKNFPSWLLLRAYGHIALYSLLNTAVLAGRGMGTVALQGRRDALAQSGRVLAKRRLVQSRVRIGRADVERLVTWRWLRVKRRIWRAERQFRGWLADREKT
jgi:GT2 family glycosyltransferase